MAPLKWMDTWMSEWMFWKWNATIAVARKVRRRFGTNEQQRLNNRQWLSCKHDSCCSRLSLFFLVLCLITVITSSNQSARFCVFVLLSLYRVNEWVNQKVAQPGNYFSSETSREWMSERQLVFAQPIRRSLAAAEKAERERLHNMRAANVIYIKLKTYHPVPFFMTHVCRSSSSSVSSGKRVTDGLIAMFTRIAGDNLSFACRNLLPFCQQ